jgi:glycine oxidase
MSIPMQTFVPLSRVGQTWQLIVSMDVVVVGAGVIGLTSALRLAEAGLRPLLIERGDPGREASWAAAGILGAQSESHGPGPFFELCLRSRALYAKLATDLRDRTGIDIGYQRCGVLHLAYDDERAAALRKTHAWQVDRGLRCDIAEQVPDHPRARLGVFMPDDGQVDSRALVEALRGAVVSHGAQILRARAVRVVHEQGRLTAIATESQTIPTGLCVVAAGCWSSAVEGANVRGVRPVKGQMLAYEPSPVPWKSVVFAGNGYAVPRQNGPLLVGATEEDAGFDKSTTEEGRAALRAIAATLSDDLARATPSDQWAGLRPGTADGLPIIGFSARSVVAATGHYRNGILLAPATAEAVVDLLAARPRQDLHDFDPRRFALDA